MTEPEESFAGPPYACKLCGAALEVRVGFQGTLVWIVDPESADFGSSEPELRGQHKKPALVCSADSIHTTGFKLLGSEIVGDPR